MKKNIKPRLEFVKKYQNWTTSEWEQVIWSDEIKINIIQNQRLKPQHIKQTAKHGGGSLMF